MKALEKNKVLKFFVLTGAGAFIGAINGFFGGGGGMICVPVLLAVGLFNRQAHATAILTMVPISIASAVVYYSSGVIDWMTLLWVTLGSVVGGVIGALLLKKIPNLVLQYLFALVVLAAGVKMLV